MSHKRGMEKVRKSLRGCDKLRTRTALRKAVDKTQSSDVNKEKWTSTEAMPAEEHLLIKTGDKDAEV
jgi:hypothetical protein